MSAFSAMRNISKILLFAGAVLCLFLLGNKKSVCQRTLRYRIDAIDPRFKITEDEVLQATQKAAAVWNNETKRSVFVYDPKGALKIRLLFDERQREALEKKQVALDIRRDQGNYDSLSNERRRLTEMYEQRHQAYNAAVAQLGGRREVSKEEFDRLEGERLALNALADQINGFTTQTNETVGVLKSNVDRFNRGAGKIFDRGEFTGSEINIYQFDNPLDLSMIFAHEFGHALLLGHVNDSKSLMYYLSRDQSQETITLTAADQKALADECSKKYALDPRTLRILFQKE